jgi:hypothetical protein
MIRLEALSKTCQLGDQPVQVQLDQYQIGNGNHTDVIAL